MLHNYNIESRHFLFAALFGILVFIAVTFLYKIPDRIHQGQQGFAAIQLLDAMRRPLLAIEETDLKTHMDPSVKTHTQASFEENITTAQTLIKRYQEASRYNRLLAKNVDALTVLIHDWIRAKRNHPSSHESLTSISQHLTENCLHLLHALALLAEGEAPIHHDIEQGQAAEHLLQWGGIILISYLFLLIILFQRIRQRKMLSAYQAVEQAQAKLKQQENYLSMTLDSIGDAMIATDAQGNVSRMNPVAETLTGWQQDEALGHPLPDVFKIINAHSRKPVDNPVEKVLSSGKIVGLANHTLLVARDGNEYQIADSGAPIMDEKGKILGVILVFRDVTEDYRQQEALHKSQNNLAEAQQLAHIGNWELDLVNDTLKWSDEIFRIFEIDPDKFQPSYESFLDSIHPDDRDMVNQAYANSLESKLPYDITHRLLMKDGRIKYVHEYCQTDFNDNSKPLRSIGVVQEITERIEIENERRQHQEQLEAEVEKRTADLSLINQELESFSYSISHDLRAPLRAINGFSVALSEDYADSLDDTANDFLRRISAGANRMSVLIDDLLMLSRINRQQLKKTTCNLSAIANKIQQQLTEQFPRDNLQWQIQEQLNISCDENLIRNALENMFSNALKYSGKKDHALIEFGCKQEDDKKIFYIRDNGAGFNMQYVDKLFGAFQRLHGSEFEGTGIGLATVQRIIHRHGGKIWVEAEVDKGATFYFTLD